MFDTSQLFGGTSAAGAFYTKTIDQSLRFNDADSPHLFWEPNDTPDGGGQKFTISFWMKRADLANYQTIYAARNGATAADYWLIGLTPDKLYIQGGYGANMNLTPTQVLRDPSAWYHIVVAADTTLATADDRVKLYINGEQVTDFSTRTNPTQNYDLKVLSTTVDQYSGRVAGVQYFDGYLAEFIVVDNQQLDPTSFGELKSGIWIAKEYSGSYGQGTHLDFADSASIGNDISGNNHDWTVNNLVASDVVPDSPTNNFATFNPLARSASTNLYEGNLRFNSPAASYRNVAATIPIMPNTGKWYWEVYVETASTSAGIVQGNPEMNRWTGGGYVLGYASTEYAKFNQYKVTNNSFSTLWGTTAGTGDIIGFEFDSDNGDLYTYLNGTIEESGTAMFSGLTSSEGYVPALSAYNSTQKINFGQDSTFAGAVTAGGNTDANGIGDFKYTVPTDAKALCTSNLPDPVIDPAQDATPEDHMDVLIYTGDGSASNEINGLNFQPDFVWIKSRNVARSHVLFDSVRGVTLRLRTDGTAAESDLGGDTLLSFDSDGFTYGADTTGNGSGDSFVAWCWKAGTAVSGTTSGSGTLKSYSGSTNTDLGFSIITYEGNGTAGHEIPHHLDAAPDLVIVKNRTDNIQWGIYHSSNNRDGDGLPETDYLRLSGVAAVADDNRFWNDTAPSSSVVTLGTIGWVNDNTDDHVMYCFRTVDQVSKCGYYIGNGNADGPFVFCGFRPKFLILVKSQSGSGDQWSMWDSVRSTSNEMSAELHTEASDDESTIRGVDFLSNGFKIREGTYTGNINTNTHRYVFYAVAEQPVKYSNAR